MRLLAYFVTTVVGLGASGIAILCAVVFFTPAQPPPSRNEGQAMAFAFGVGAVLVALLSFLLGRHLRQGLGTVDDDPR